jgi:hypothetical protein
MIILMAIVAATLYTVLSRSLAVTHVALGTALPTAIGAEVLRRQGEASTFALLCLVLSPALLALSYEATRRFSTTGMPPSAAPTNPRQGNTAGESAHIFRLTRTAVYLGVAYHFYAGGLPILNQNTEIARLDFTSSGLLGIPGRLYLFGLPLVVALTAAEARHRGLRPSSYGPLRWGVAVFTLSRLLSGFKSGLLEVIVTLIVIRLISSEPIRPGAAIRKYVVPIMAALGVAYAVGTTYHTYTSGAGVSGALRQRITTGSAQSSTIVLDGQVPRLDSGRLCLTNDFWYYFHEYSHLGMPVSYSYEKLVSATLTNQAPDSPFLAPVTTGGFADLYYDFGLLIAVAGFIAVGVVLAILVNFARATSDQPIPSMVVFSLVMAVLGYITKGDLFYNLFNWEAVVGMVALIAGAGVLAGRAEYPSYRPRARQRAAR